KAKGVWNGPLEKRHTGGKKGARRPSRLLRDLRAVYEQDKEKDSSPGQRALRQLFEENPKEFINQLRQAEREYQAQGRAAGSPKQAARPVEPAAVTEKPDEGTQRALLLAQQILEQAGESVKIGSRVSDAWDDLCEDDKRSILDILDAAPTNARPASRRAHP